MLSTLILATSVLVAAATSAATAPRCCANVELRQYTVVPGRLDPFITLFEREFIETQEELGPRVIGQFRDVANPNRFVWLRGFSDMPSRVAQLQAFYGGPVWKAHREEANANFTDTDNVLLLRSASSDSQFDLAHATRAPIGATENPGGLLVATIYYFDAPVDDTFVKQFEKEARPILRAAKIEPIAWFVSETEPNNFPRLPVREKDHVFVWFAMFDNAEEFQRRTSALHANRKWKTEADELRRHAQAAPEVLQLTPTPRSLLHR